MFVSVAMVGFIFAFLTFAQFIASEYSQSPCHCACNCYCHQPQKFCGNMTTSTYQNDYFAKPRDCQDIYQMGFTKTGGYIIYPKGHSKGIYVRCDMHTAGGGWTVIQRRINGDVDFYREWFDYKEGFGDPNGNLWLGNEKIHDLTTHFDYQLRIDLVVSEANKSFAFYDRFSVSDESSGYILNVKGYSGTVGDSLSQHSGMKFSTKDRDNDNESGSCANTFKGGWWYKGCYDSNLNGIYGSNMSKKGINWYSFAGLETSMIFTDMKIRRKIVD